MNLLFIIYLLFGLMPCLVWLFYYLRKDKHSEPNWLILKIFLLGAIATIPTLFVELGLLTIFEYLKLPFVFAQIIRWFLIIALTEEIFKYLVVRLVAMRNKEFDEPIDAMIYMVVSALGFASAENILYLTLPALQQPASLVTPFNYIITNTAIISAGRFLGANFLHTLCSATIGYFIALSICNKKNSARLMALGFFTATGLHGFYNFSIMNIGQGIFATIVPAIILIILNYFVLKEFNKLKKLKSICKINA